MKNKKGSAKMNFRHSTCLNFSGCIRTAMKAMNPDIAIKGANPLVAVPKLVLQAIENIMQRGLFFLMF